MNGDLFFYSVAGFFAGLAIFVLGLFWFRRKQLIENIPTSKIRSLAMGLVEVYGDVVTAYKGMLKSPFSGDDCVYYRFTVEEQRRNAKRGMLPNIVIGENPQVFSPQGGRWSVVKKGEDMAHFYLKDPTGQVLVDPAGAKIDIKPDYEFTSGLGKDPPEKVLSFLSREGINHESFFSMNKEMRFREYVIRPKDKLYILGTAADNPFVEEGTAKHSTEDIMIHKGNNEKFYYISDSSERDILGRLRWKVYGGIGGGIALVAVCLSLIFLYTGLL
jgi:hypothetical protein